MLPRRRWLDPALRAGRQPAPARTSRSFPRLQLALVVLALLGNMTIVDAQQAEPNVVQVAALAVSELPNGTLVGSTAQVTVTVVPKGGGDVYVSTLPLAELDMQGSARLAAKVAAATIGVSRTSYDYLYRIESEASLIGGPSAGGVLTVATIAAIQGWAVRADVAMTGTINPDGTIGPVGGVVEKATAAAAHGAATFVYPVGDDAAQDRTLAATCARLAIACTPVATIEEAVEVFTGYTFAPSGASIDLDTALFTRIMSGSASESLEMARVQLAEASAAFEGAEGELSPTVAASLRQSLDDAGNLLAEAEAAEAEASYYTLANRAFAASIETRYVLTTISAFRDPSTVDISNVTADVEARFAEARSAIGSISPVTTANAQFLAAAQTRLLEAEATLSNAEDSARVARTVPQILSALYNLGYAHERAETAAWWAGLAAETVGGDARLLSEEDLLESARSAIGEARDAITYAELLVSQSQADMSHVRAASTTLAEAERALQHGYAAAAAHEATSALVRANLAVELIGVSDALLAERIELARQNADAALSDARARGEEPVMAQTFYELAESIGSPVEQLAYYQLARVVARLDPLIGQDAQAPQAVAAAATPLAQASTATQTWAWVLVGSISASTVGFFTGRLTSRHGRRCEQEGIVLHTLLEAEPPAFEPPHTDEPTAEEPPADASRTSAPAEPGAQTPATLPVEIDEGLSKDETSPSP